MTSATMGQAKVTPRSSTLNIFTRQGSTGPSRAMSKQSKIWMISRLKAWIGMITQMSRSMSASGWSHLSSLCFS
eukprot:CAMPEP_0206458160 /NCGR_PEP_ID=MMETSP0324_2-20121206/23394_1 /ASSEMBLY_ACC=CAM_ASM_000836 /TAXON_ID=2866 /ORGANISM="Crypthecodinium cohnii, Strain Seligo" /LENGTH=73 /DNA_ID=CAMNT_0053929425 /DNA_START=472 /DNA_END=693 /DNA_ORIENTATION=+